MYNYLYYINQSIDEHMKIAYFGIPGSFTHSAATDLFPKQTFVGATSFEDIFVMLQNNKVDRGVIPIENTLAGSIYENYDLLESYNMAIVDETYLKVEHCLLGKTKSVSDITKVYSHPKALEQCSIFFSEHPKIEQKASTNTASAAMFVSESDDKTIAAIAGKEAADAYTLEVIVEHLENNEHNFTRFLVIARKDPRDNGEVNKCSIIVNLPHRPGSLGAIFALLAGEGCNLTKIESRPMHDKPFEYVFYLDFIFDPKEHQLDTILKEVEKNTLVCRLLGVYKDARA